MSSASESRKFWPASLPFIPLLPRLNNLMVLHVHKDVTDQLSLKDLAYDLLENLNIHVDVEFSKKSSHGYAETFFLY